MPLPFRLFPLFLFLCLQSAPTHAAQIELSIANIVSPAFSAKSVVVTLLKNGAADLQIAEITLGEKSWHKVHLHCAEFSLSAKQVLCRHGKLSAAPDLPFTVRYEYATQQLDLNLAAGANESFQLHADFQARPWRISSKMSHAQAFRLAALMPEGGPLPSKGTLSGSIELQGGKQGLGHVHADILLADVAFSDSSGLHAGENIRAKINLAATHEGLQWNSRIELDWQGGELFWQPLYLKGGHSLQAEGGWDGKLLNLTQANVNLDGVGEIELNAAFDITTKQLLGADISANHLNLERLFSDYAKPFLTGGALAEGAMSGSADLNWKYSKGTTQALQIGLHDASFVDGKKRYALYGLNADIPWHPEYATTARLSYGSGALWGVPLGASEINVKMQGLDFSIAEASLPILDGKLSVRDFHLQHVQDEWQWQFSGGLTPISMPPLSRALGWPEMQGALSGMIPHVNYQAKSLNVNGALLFRVFDGSVVVSKLNLFDPFGPAPRLYGNLDMRQLDLGALTRAFSFGNVQGRIDVGVQELELVNWLPVHFDAKVASSPGSYRKRISQKAVQNISSLGGAGAAAAVQRSVMSVFENFGYERIELSCVLRNGICLMNGAEPGANGYFIVKGGGIPAINVMGYNHNVDWDELLLRLKRVIKSNRKAVVE